MVVIHVEGNIGSGKTTFINALKHRYPDSVLVLEEHINDWEQSGLWNRYCLEPHMYCGLFQKQVIETYDKQLKTNFNAFKKALNDPNILMISDRSIYSVKEVFIPLMHEMDYITRTTALHLETSMERWCPSRVGKGYNTFEMLYSRMVLLTTDPDICLRRIEKRGRPGEQYVTLSYLWSIQGRHLEWFCNNCQRYDQKPPIQIHTKADPLNMIAQLKARLPECTFLQEDDELVPDPAQEIENARTTKILLQGNKDFKWSGMTAADE